MYGSDSCEARGADRLGLVLSLDRQALEVRPNVSHW